MNTLAEHNDVRTLHLETLSSAIATSRSVANDAEVGEHGFLLTGDDRYLLTLESANGRLGQAVQSLEAETDSLEPSMRTEVADFLHLVRERVQIANYVLEVQRNSGFPAALEAARASHSENLMDRLRRDADALTKGIDEETNSHLEYDRHLTHTTFLLFLFGTLAMLVILVWLYNAYLANMNARDLANHKLQVLNSDLEIRISERTRELQEFNDELQQFAYVASHDLQEPLRTITSFTQLLSSRYRGKLDEDADEFMDYTVNAARRMTDLINGLLALVRLRKSGQPTAPVSLNALLEEAEVSLQASIRESGARIESGPLPSLTVDGVQFAQVLQNLISNAIKYHGPQPPVIRISARREATNWIITVADNGRGFDPQFAERIFGLFQRLHVREVDGTGMGLSIVRRIVERHGGRIWAESVEGAGSTFFLSLPTSLESHAAERQSLEAEESAAV
jgi:signal transduction histidine kinase